MIGDNVLHEICVGYASGKRRLIDLGFAVEIDWQEDADPALAGEYEILREGAWAILSCGLSEKAVRSVFPRLTSVFGHWKSSFRIAADRERIVESAMDCFGHRGKLHAIVDLAEFVSNQGPRACMSLLEDEPQALVAAVPYLGPVSILHLKKSLGFLVAKPDRHLQRLSEALGTSTEEMCSMIAAYTSEKVSVVDLVLWRLSEQGLVSDYFQAYPPQAPN